MVHNPRLIERAQSWYQQKHEVHFQLVYEHINLLRVSTNHVAIIGDVKYVKGYKWNHKTIKTIP